MFLVEIERDGAVLPAIGPHQRLRDNDRLVFAGIVDSVVDLQRIRGLVPASDQVFKLGVPRPERCLTEAVVSDSCPLVGKTIREGRFRNVYNAAVIAVARNGERVRGVQNELQVGPPSGLSERANDTYLTSLVKTRFLEASSKFSATHVKVVTERGVVYLMGLVKRDEADAAAAIAASTRGVVRVVKVFEYMD
jgi:hypothetical protein